MSRVLALTNRLLSLGIPVEGVSRGDTVRIDFLAAATSEQRESAASIASEWDWRPAKAAKQMAEEFLAYNADAELRGPVWLALVRFTLDPIARGQFDALTLEQQIALAGDPIDNSMSRRQTILAAAQSDPDGVKDALAAISVTYDPFEGE